MRWALIMFALLPSAAWAQSRSQIEAGIAIPEMQFEIDQLRQQLRDLKREVDEDRQQRLMMAPPEQMSPEWRRYLTDPNAPRPKN